MQSAASDVKVVLNTKILFMKDLNLPASINCDQKQADCHKGMTKTVVADGILKILCSAGTITLTGGHMYMTRLLSNFCIKKSVPNAVLSGNFE